MTRRMPPKSAAVMGMGIVAAVALSGCGGAASRTAVAGSPSAPATSPSAAPATPTPTEVAATATATATVAAAPTRAAVLGPRQIPTVQPNLTAFPIFPSQPGSGSSSDAVDNLRMGPDGALWFTVNNINGRTGWVGRITRAGSVTTWLDPNPGGYLGNLTFGGGYLWVVEWHNSGQSFISQWDLTGTHVRDFPISDTAYGIVWGPDGAVWFGGAHVVGMSWSSWFIGRMTTLGTVTRFSLPDPSSVPGDLTVGPDGAIWFSESQGSNIGRVTTAGAVAEYAIPNTVRYWPSKGDQSITTGPDGAIWEAAPGGVVRAGVGGDVHVFTLAGLAPWQDITSGPGGDIWYMHGDFENSAVVRLSTTGAGLAQYPVGSTYTTPGVITTGPDGNIWFGAAGVIVRMIP